MIVTTHTEIHIETSIMNLVYCTLPKQIVVSVSSLSLSTYCRLDIQRSCLQTIPLASRIGVKALIEKATIQLIDRRNESCVYTMHHRYSRKY